MNDFDVSSYVKPIRSLFGQDVAYVFEVFSSGKIRLNI
jgi:hypothetical protein